MHCGCKEFVNYKKQLIINYTKNEDKFFSNSRRFFGKFLWKFRQNLLEFSGLKNQPLAHRPIIMDDWF
ncbi:MAG: hypothetical protein CMM52_05010 [Rhodospirillaceae bacterium]|nr:hypothetical protein [Rhodospirillaceae bacterium]